MMYPYMTLSDETEIHQDVNFLNTNGQKKKDIVMKKSHSLKNCSIAMLIYYTNTLQMEE